MNACLYSPLCSINSIAQSAVMMASTSKKRSGALCYVEVESLLWSDSEQSLRDFDSDTEDEVEDRALFDAEGR
jgi:hypothetical protein